jgi:hypothetical protein
MSTLICNNNNKYVVLVVALVQVLYQISPCLAQHQHFTYLVVVVVVLPCRFISGPDDNDAMMQCKKVP